MRLMILLDYYRPGYRAGGPIRSIENLCHLLSSEFRITTLSRNHDFNQKEVYPLSVNCIHRTPNEDRYYLKRNSLFGIFRSVFAVQPDIVLLNSFFSSLTIKYLILVKFKLIRDKKIILAPRGELMPSALDIKTIKKKAYLFVAKYLKLYSSIDAFMFTSNEEKNKSLALTRSKSFVVDNIPAPINTCSTVKKSPGELKVMYSGRVHPIKNLGYALDVLEMFMFSNQNCNMTFDIYGLIEDDVYWSMCNSKITNIKKKFPIKINFLGAVAPEKYDNLLCNYHALLLPTKTENFSHSIVECMMAGIVPIISENTPWVDLSSKENGWSLSLLDKLEFVKALEYLSELSQYEFSIISKNVVAYAQKKLDIPEIIKQYVLLLSNGISNEN